MDEVIIIIIMPVQGMMDFGICFRWIIFKVSHACDS
jgi:hypothetical protein